MSSIEDERNFSVIPGGSEEKKEEIPHDKTLRVRISLETARGLVEFGESLIEGYWVREKRELEYSSETEARYMERLDEISIPQTNPDMDLAIRVGQLCNNRLRKANKDHVLIGLSYDDMSTLGGLILRDSSVQAEIEDFIREEAPEAQEAFYSRINVREKIAKKADIYASVQEAFVNAGGMINRDLTSRMQRIRNRPFE